MDTEIDSLARRVAEATDAWLRDPLDTQVYRRLVDATLEWRAGSSLTPEPPLDAPVDEVPSDGADAVPVERRPQRLDMLLGPLAEELRARTEQAPT